MPCQRHIALLVGALAAVVVLPKAAEGQRSGVEIWAAVCGNCHLIQPASRYSAKDWDAIGTHMTITARLTDDQSKAVLEFLKTNAKRSEDCCREGTDAPAATPDAPRSNPTALSPDQAAAVAKYVKRRTKTR